MVVWNIIFPESIGSESNHTAPIVLYILLCLRIHTAMQHSGNEEVVGIWSAWLDGCGALHNIAYSLLCFIAFDKVA